MALSITIPEAEPLESGLWRTRLSKEDLHFLGTAASRIGPRSVLLVTAKPSFDKETRSLRFDPSATRLLNLGSSEDTVIVESALENDAAQESAAGRLAIEPAKGISVKPHETLDTDSGDLRFLKSLPVDLKELGSELLRRVRSEFPGHLQYFERSSKFVETPDNFWTAKIQGRDLSLRITVRGEPQSFGQLRTITLRPDMAGYSSFKVSSPGHVEEFMRVLRQVPKKNRLG